MAHRLSSEVRVVVTALLDPRGCLASKLAFLACASYLIGPVDLIPDRLPIVGHLDEVVAIPFGMVAARALVPTSWVGPRPRRTSRIGFGRRAAWALRAASFDVLAFASGRLLLRLVLDRWPDAGELRRFRRGLHHSSAPLPPLLRGFAAVPDARAPLTRAMLLSWLHADESYRGPMRRGRGSYVPPGDYLRVWTKPPISFLHFEKTAGTTVTTLLSAHFHPTQIDPDSHRSAPPHVLTPFPPHAARRLGGYPLVHGHYDVPSLRRLGRDRFVFTVLREPRARLLSLYYYWRSVNLRTLNDEGDHRNVRLAHERDLLGFLSSEEPFIVDYLDNLYVRRLTGFYVSGCDVDPLALAPAESVRAASQVLDALDFVGVTERLDEVMVEIGKVLELGPLEAVPVLNDAAGNRRDRPGEFHTVAREPITPAIEAALDHLTRLDRVLYRRAAKRFEASALAANGSAARASARWIAEEGEGSGSALTLAGG